MGLNDLEGMDVPDNKGGRPTKDEEDDTRGRTAEGDGLTLKKETKDWWRMKFKKFKNEEDDVDDAIMEMAEHISVSPIIARKKLQEYDLYETDWEEYIEKYTIYENDLRIPINEASGTGTAGLSGLFSDPITSNSSSSNDDEPSSGLSSMIDGQ